jgi:beta-glucosidase
VPTVVYLYLDRPAIVPEIAAGTAALRSPTAATPAHLQTWCLGWPGRKARLPFDLPSSTRSVEDSRSDVPCHSTLPDPLFRFGHDQVPRLAPI